jgi:endogenous inhibitor of DNA gyrase (YacG/DUF329 family)
MGRDDRPDKAGNSRSFGDAEPMELMRCPICNTPMMGNWHDYPDYPFCSKRCRVIDLGRWLSEEYRISDAAPEEDRSTPPDG